MVTRRKGSEIASSSELRRRAELRSTARPNATVFEPAELQRLVQELEIHQAELELQNEELQATSRDLERARDRYFELYDLAPVSHVNLDLEGTIVEANHAATALIGGDRRDLLGRKLSSFISTADADAFHLHRLEALDRGVAACEVALRKTGAKPTPVHVRSKALRSVDGRAEGLLCVLFDLSDLRRAERQLHLEEERARESEAKLREIAEHVDDVLMLREQDGTFTYVSPAYERIWGRPAAEIIGGGAVWRESIHPEDRARLVHAEARLEAGSSFEKTYRICRPDGDVRWVRSRFFPFEARPGERLRYVGIAQDVTSERERTEEMRRAHTAEVLGALSGAIAHDFGNLLQGIMGCADVALESKTLPERRQVYLERIVSAVKRGSGLVDQLMAFNRKKPVDLQPTCVDDVVRELEALVERLLGEHIRLEIKLGAPEGLILVDAVQIEQILMNLAANARDAMPEGGTFTIETDVVQRAQERREQNRRRTKSRCVRLTVSDTGSGMDEATKSRIFEPFFTTKAPGLGTGIGLSSVSAITRSLGGRVDVESEVGRGSRFVFYFPCTDDEPTVAAPPTAEGRFRGRALLVEDDALVRTTVRHYLEELGLHVVEAAGATQALEACDLSPGSLDLCISDVTMPGTSGPRLVRQLQERYPGLRALFISAHPSSELVARGILDEEAMLLQKPFGRPELAAKLATLSLD